MQRDDGSSTVPEPSGMGAAMYVAGYRPCGYCGNHIQHIGVCPRVKAIEYHPNGSVKRVEFHDGGVR